MQNICNLDKKAIQVYIRKQRRKATESEKRMLKLMQSWLSVWPEEFDARVRRALAEAEQELAQPFDASDEFEVSWRSGCERDVRVFGPMVKLLDEQKAGKDD